MICTPGDTCSFARTMGVRTPVPWSTSTLALSLCYTLDDGQSAEQLRRRDPQQVAEQCASATRGLLPPGTRVVARVDAAPDGPVNVTTVHKRPASSAWHKDHHHLRIELMYGTGAQARQVAVRCLVELPQLDGVTGLRFTLTVLEALLGGGQASAATESFKRMPPLRYTTGHAVRFIRRLADLVPRLLYAWLFQPAVSELQTMVPTTPAGIFAFYRQRKPPLGVFRSYAPAGNAGAAFKAMIAALSGWATRPPRRRGYYVLINLPPAVVASIVPNPADVMDTEARYAGALLPPGPPPTGAPWVLLNHIHAEHIFINNYGRHSHPGLPAGRATGFLWDWIGLAAPICGIGCVTVNDAFLAWRRGTAADLDTSEALFAASLGKPVQETTQLVR